MKQSNEHKGKASVPIPRIVACIEDQPPIPTRVLALYKFVTPKIKREFLKELQHILEAECRKYKARGTLLIAEEGINGTICYPFEPDQKEDHLLTFLQSTFDNGLRTRISRADRLVFARLKIKIKSEIVTMHQEECSPTESKGLYVKPDEWNQLIQDPDCLVIDTRNEYEIHVGNFRNAVNPKTQSFVEFPDWMEQNIQGNQAPKKIAMFCKYNM